MFIALDPTCRFSHGRSVHGQHVAAHIIAQKVSGHVAICSLQSRGGARICPSNLSIEPKRTTVETTCTILATTLVLLSALSTHVFDGKCLGVCYKKV